ncbi:MalY/PatB family protein [Miniphocaeibacter massiliensis]|uniref:MalY/PatB family protein n=1 Tax=Miniphocaeibacter massiliensis TaxID=2041841 RepID=UPI0013E9B54F|nr:MalY/PatB family protein [Miniphocaeibacter massiliensis]
MRYDFDSYLNRRETGSSKWLNMDSRNPNVDRDVVPMSVADMDFLTCTEINEEICNYVNSQTLGYSKPVDSYLQTVVDFFREHHNYSAEKDWIVTTPGIVSALATSVNAFTEIGDEVIIFTPVYHPFYEVIEGQKRVIKECPLIYNNNAYSINFELLEKLASSSKVKMILFCNPHNPGGIVWSKEELIRIEEIAVKYDLLIVSDEIHSDIVFKGKKHMVFGSISETIGERCVVCTAASKTFNIAGLQCSNIFIKNEDLRNEFVTANVNIGLERANILGMVATKAAYEKGLNWLDEVKTIIEKNNNIVEKFFNSYNNLFKVMKPEASFLTWVNFENLEIEHEEFMKFLDIKCEFFVNDGLSFGENGKYFIRINTGLPTKKLEENLERLKKYLKECYNVISK